MFKKKGSVFYLTIFVSITVIIFIHWFFSLPAVDVVNLDIDKCSKLTNVSGGLKVMDLNMHYGKGVEDDDDYPVDVKTTVDNLDAMIDIVDKYDPDVLTVQEVDFFARRSGYINQVDYLKNRLNFSYVTAAIDWDVRYVPYPYFPPSKNIGRVKSGVAIFSKYPIINSTIYLFDKPTGNSWYYNLFYLDRLVQRVVLDINGIDVVLYNVHLEAFDKNTREKQAAELAVMLSNKDGKVVLVGDLNAVPSEAKIKVGYEDEPDNDYDDSVVEILREVLREVGSNGFTYPSYNPNRKLDYVFSNLDEVDYEVVESEVSDHLPVYVEFNVSG